MRRAITIFYLSAWILCFSLYVVITYNRRTQDSLGIYGLSGQLGRFLDVAIIISFFMIPLLSIVMMFRMKRWLWFRPLEVMLAIGTWWLFLYNLSFFRG